MNKEQARILGLTGRKNIPDKERKRRSHEIFLKLLPYLKRAKKIGCYVSLYEEVSTDEILVWCFENQKEVYVPKVKRRTLRFYEIHSFDDLKEGSFHVKEPVTDREIPVRQLDMMIVPVVAFDEEGNRCGFGKGYYDSVLNDSQLKTGIAYKEQKVEHIDFEEHDVKLDEIIVG